jgi:hypothetical protein
MTQNFLLITPEGWTEVENATAIINGNVGEDGMSSIITTAGYSQIDEFQGIKETAYLPEGFTVVEASMYNTREQPNPLRLWLRIAPVTPEPGG